MSIPYLAPGPSVEQDRSEGNATPSVPEHRDHAILNRADPKANEPKYMPQLDALRVFAVTAVLLEHYWGKLPFALERLNWGFLGVHLFFVLSGFLITGILLGCRDTAGEMKQNRWFSIRQFYLRRFLRIFPLYYFVIAVAFAANLEPAREIMVWLITYTLNIFVSHQGAWSTAGRLGHFWSLAVEEQFYVAWPLLVLFAPRKWLVPMTVVLISLGPLYRLYAVINNPNGFTDHAYTATAFTLAALDTLGLGALLAMAHHSSYPKRMLQKSLNRLVLPIGSGATFLLYALVYFKIDWKAYAVFADLTVGLVFCWLVSWASLGFKGIIGTILAAKPLVYTGKITYGIYVYHNFVPLFLTSLFAQIGLEYPKWGPTNFALSSVATLMVASLSWHLFEQPLNNLKRYVHYHSRPTKNVSGVRVMEDSWLRSHFVQNFYRRFHPRTNRSVDRESRRRGTR
jgi:peptidoglycan/LPS O-acetylase OafA/YrhL